MIPGWESIHPDDSSKNAVSFQERQAEENGRRPKKIDLIRVREGNNNLVFIPDTGSPTSFINNRTATLLQNTVKQARRKQLRQNDDADRMVGYKIPSFDRIVTLLVSRGWTVDTASSIVVDDKRAIMGRNLLPLLGIHLFQEKLCCKSTHFLSDTKQSDAFTTN